MEGEAIVAVRSLPVDDDQQSGGAAVELFMRRAGERGTTFDLDDGTLEIIRDLSFGGENLDTLLVTSARFTMTPEHLAEHPNEGALVAVNVGVKGRPANRFATGA